MPAFLRPPRTLRKPSVGLATVGGARCVVRPYIRPKLRVLPGHRARFFSGDWARLSELLLHKREKENPPGDSCEGAIPSRARPPLPADGFDLILSSETIYEADSTSRLWSLIQAQLHFPSGVALVAAKSYYFGVGGSVAAFRSLVEADGRFSCSTVRVIENGASNRREVLAVRWRSLALATGYKRQGGTVDGSIASIAECSELTSGPQGNGLGTSN